jgi:hypothetical protein
MAQAVAIAQMHNPQNPQLISQSKGSRAKAIAQMPNPQNLNSCKSTIVPTHTKTRH